MWRIRYVSYDVTASRHGERFWKRLGRLPEPEFMGELRERCSCLEHFDSIKHNNGGFYHGIWLVFRLDERHVLIVETNTRESFTPWEQGYIFLQNSQNGSKYCVWTEKISDCRAYVYTVEEAKKEISNLLSDEEVYIAEGEENLAKILTS
jgi:hypothetical protein